MAGAWLVVRATVADAADRARFDHWYRTEHLPDAVKGPEPSFELPFKGHVGASDEESARNPRARSAKLRTGQRTDAPARGLDAELAAMAALPTRTGKGR